jgi:1-aminocyclopropane-1-carboxylate deaminase/D-cysteine desulfhydrase-like pyridoxal-dependent ACC family enzyme
VIPVGGSEAAGAWGHALAAIEVADQAADHELAPDVIVLPTATGGTQAGLVVGSVIAASRGATLPAQAAPMRVVGVAVAHPAAELRQNVERLVRELATLAGIVPPLDRIEIDSDQLGDGYGIPSPASREAAGLLARNEGFMVDPVYTAKGLGLVSLVRSGELDGKRAIFWHGGGLPALFEAAEA